MILWKTLFFRHNRRENKQLCTEYGLCDYIRAQEDAGVREMRYGLGHMAYNGCEVIACHHALLSLGIPSRLWQTADFFERHGIWLLGLFGTYPHALFRFCRSHGLVYRRYHVPILAEKRKLFSLPGEDVVLYSYWNPGFRGIHTVELHKTPGGYMVTNVRRLYRVRFATMGNALRAIRTPMPILCLGVKKVIE